MIRSINAVLLHSADPARLVRFYRDVVGLPLRTDDHGDGVHAECDLGGLHFAIFPGGGAPPGPGPVTLSLHVDDVQAEYDRLRARGVEFTSAPSLRPFGGVLAEFRDPDGNGLCLMAWGGG